MKILTGTLDIKQDLLLIEVCSFFAIATTGSGWLIFFFVDTFEKFLEMTFRWLRARNDHITFPQNAKNGPTETAVPCFIMSIKIALVLPLVDLQQMV